MTAVGEIDAALIGLRRMWSHSGTFEDPELGRIDLSTVLVCRELATARSEVSVAGIAAGLDVAHSTASRLVERAEQCGAVRRVPSPRDGRSTSVVLTPAGRRLHRTATTFRARYLGHLLAGWDPRDLDHFARLLTRFEAAVHDNPPKEAP